MNNDIFASWSFLQRFSTPLCPKTLRCESTIDLASYSNDHTDYLTSLQLKSAPTHQSSGVNTAPDAVVCTLNETFEVRQVQSSNVLYILQSIEGSKEGTIDASYSGGVTAIAQCKGLLELVKASPVPEQYLRTHVHIYRYEAGTSSVAAHGPTKQELLDDAPFSSGEFQAAWEQLCIFELEGKLWLPAASILRKTWTSFLSAALVEDVDATKPFQVDTVKVLVEEDGYLGSLLEAIFTQVASKMDDITSGHMHHDHNQSNANAIKVVLIDREKCIEWLGSILVELASQVPLRLLNFIEEWRNMVPEVWREHVDLTKLRVCRV